MFIVFKNIGKILRKANFAKSSEFSFTVLGCSNRMYLIVEWPGSTTHESSVAWLNHAGDVHTHFGFNVKHGFGLFKYSSKLL